MRREAVSVAQGNAVDHPEGRVAVGEVVEGVDVKVDDVVVMEVVEVAGGVGVGVGDGVEVDAVVAHVTSAKLGFAATPIGLKTAPVS
jgi:hypothetical protein